MLILFPCICLLALLKSPMPGFALKMGAALSMPRLTSEGTPSEERGKDEEEEEGQGGGGREDEDEGEREGTGSGFRTTLGINCCSHSLFEASALGLPKLGKQLDAPLLSRVILGCFPHPLTLCSSIQPAVPDPSSKLTPGEGPPSRFEATSELVPGSSLPNCSSQLKPGGGGICLSISLLRMCEGRLEYSYKKS